MSKTFFFVGVMLLAATGCGGTIESEQQPDPSQVQVDTGAPPEAAAEDGEVKAMACTLDIYLGMGSCHQTCNLTGSFCSEGTKQWSCFAINYEHWRSFSGADQWRARGWENAWVTKCQNTNPVNCPSFCG
jgi:hypothetical protein